MLNSLNYQATLGKHLARNLQQKRIIQASGPSRPQQISGSESASDCNRRPLIIGRS